MERLDPITSEDEGIARRLIDVPLGRRELAGGDGEALRRQRQPVDFLGVAKEGLVARLAHVGDDRADGSLDILGGFPLGREKGREARLEIGPHHANRLCRRQNDDIGRAGLEDSDEREHLTQRCEDDPKRVERDLIRLNPLSEDAAP